MNETYWLDETALVVHSTREGNAEPQKVNKRSSSNCAGPFLCTWRGCAKEFNSSYGLKVHYRSHTDERPFACTYADCKKAFKTSGDLQKHTRTHTGEKPYKCPVDGCDKAFTTSNNCKMHVRTHTGEKPHKCQLCNKTFSNIGNFRNHQRIHTGEKPFKCLEKGCRKTFTEYSSLYKHQAVHRKRICKDCGKIFRKQDGLSRHRLTTHHPKKKARGVIVEITAYDDFEHKSDNTQDEDEKCKDEEKLAVPLSAEIEHQQVKIAPGRKRTKKDLPEIFFNSPKKRQRENEEIMEREEDEEKKQEEGYYPQSFSRLCDLPEGCSTSQQIESVDESSTPVAAAEESFGTNPTTILEIDGQPFTFQLLNENGHEDNFVGTEFVDRFIISDARIEGVAAPCDEKRDNDDCYQLLCAPSEFLNVNTTPQ